MTDDQSFTPAVRRAAAAIDRDRFRGTAEDLALSAVTAALAIDEFAASLEAIGAINHNQPTDAGPWVNAPLSVVIDTITGRQDQ